MLWCDHAEGFESGLRAWDLDVGEWERASGTALADTVKYTVMIRMAPIFLWNSLQLGTPTVPLFEQLCCNGGTLPEALERIRPCQLEMEQAQMMTTGCKSTLSRKARGRAKANTKSIKRIARATRAMQTSTRERTVAELDIGRKTAGDQVEGIVSTNNVPDGSQTRSSHESTSFNVGVETIHDRTGQPVVNRDESGHEQTMLNEVNTDFRTLGLPHSVVKHAESSRVRELVKKIENHPDRHALQLDLQQNRAYNPFSATAKKMIVDVGNVQLFDLFEADPETQCKACLSYWSEGIVYCTCGHLLKETVANRSFFKNTLDILSIPEYVRREDLMATDMGKLQKTKIIWPRT